ncbi:unnamed protein product [Pieris macdunnoughi]|uniref:Uncharacterized protein n=1 Tax=Pieris macdunnoughi TaxID=345717 RepID=A0A821SKE3_9NEOP|nr:unnamed protein product [Pieris macdunnoughi]
MKLYPFEYCCFCVDLRLGSLIIGCINLLGNIVLEVFACYGLEGGVLLQSLNIIGANELGVSLVVSNSILVVIITVFIGFSCLLLFGIYTNRRSFVKMYLIYALVFLVVYAITFFVQLGNGITGVGDIIEGVVTIFCNIYFNLVIKSYYDVMLVDDVQATYRS